MTQARAETLRHHLKLHTRDLHDRLDRSLAPLALGDDAEYADFLKIQFSVRCAIEDWAAGNLPDGLQIPSALANLSSDLADLGVPLPACAKLLMPERIDPLGVVWAVGGSSLGNRAMVTRRRRAGLMKANRFLTDPAQAKYFSRVIPSLNREVTAAEARPAIKAAKAVFNCYLTALTDGPLLLEAA